MRHSVFPVVFLLILGYTVAQKDGRRKRSRVDPPLCKVPPEFTVDGQDMMLESRGKFIFVALMEVHCQFCHRQING